MLEYFKVLSDTAWFAADPASIIIIIITIIIITIIIIIITIIIYIF